MTDSQDLLAEYRRNGSDVAFRELVERFVDLVHSTALRLVEGDTHRAEDVTQTVFVDLARAARTLSHEVMLGGWLHRHTCFVAANILRGERRRQARERQAVEMNALQNLSEADFSQVAPLLDEAINELGDADRTAILLRFFEQEDFRAVGQALGSTEDAARMRVTRALEKLEEFLKRRGVTTTATSLGVVLTANAVQAAPVGLAVTISTAAALAGTTIATTATATATKAIAMTTLQKALIVATIVAAVGTGIYKARQASTLHSQSQADIKTDCIDNLRLIDATRQQCALENKLGVTNVVTTEQILPYIIGHQLPQCPSGGTYTFGRLTNAPSCSIPGHVLTPLPRVVKTAYEQAEFQALTEAIDAYKRNPNGPAPEEFPKELDAAWKSYHTKNPGQALTDLYDLEPYTTTPEQAEALHKLIDSLAK